MGFMGHRSVDFAYEDEEGEDVLRGRIELDALATLGPTHAVLDRDVDLIVRSVMVTTMTASS